ncbi:hypothetical protein ACLOJK_003008 [Asimina triloba]
MKGEQHFILVHGACHGAWCWYKLATLLRSAGHRATPVDLAGSGINPENLVGKVSTFADYTQPLLDALASLPPEPLCPQMRGLGGISLALAMDQFPEKVAVGVFLTAFMPDSLNSPSYVLDKYFERIPLENFIDTRFAMDRGTRKPSTMLFGPRFLEQKLYQLSPPEDLTLAMSLVRVGSLFREDLSIAPTFSPERYGSVNRVYIICDNDLTIPNDFQHWMVENYPVQEVKEIKDADHMPMFCKPQELCKYLQEIAEMYD